MMKEMKGWIVLTLIALNLIVVNPLQAEELRLSVAASMTDLFKEIKDNFVRRHPGAELIINFGPSGGLAKQINQGAPTDIYVSANPKWMNYLIEQKKIEKEDKTIFAHNSLVFVGHSSEGVTSLRGLVSLKYIERIGIGSPKSVPAGQYAKQAMDKDGIYNHLLAEGKLVMAKDVRQALIYADRGETDGSFVYKTDALLAKRAVILFEVPQKLYDRVTYPFALTLAGKKKTLAKEFVSYLTGSEAAASIKKYGFTLPE